MECGKGLSICDLSGKLIVPAKQYIYIYIYIILSGGGVICVLMRVIFSTYVDKLFLTFCSSI